MAEESKKDLLERVTREINNSPEALALLSQVIGKPLTQVSSLEEFGLGENELEEIRTAVRQHLLTSQAKPGPSGKPN